MGFGAKPQVFTLRGFQDLRINAFSYMIHAPIVSTANANDRLTLFIAQPTNKAITMLSQADIESSLAHIHTAYDTLQLLLASQSQSIAIPPNQIASLLEPINDKLKGLMTDIKAARISALVINAK